MRFILLTFITLSLIHSQNLLAQDQGTPSTDKVYTVVEEMPRFPGCEVGVMTLEERYKCAEKSMLNFIYSTIAYPDSARAHGTEGRVVLQFVVTKDGQVADPEILKDIGDGCGEEALRALKLMQEKNIIWKPGMKDSLAVSVKYTLPVKFKIKEYTPPSPYTIFKGDSIYLELETGVEFKGGGDALKIFLATETMYPDSGLDSCLIGSMKSDLIVKKDGSVQLLETVDYSNLGTDFLFEVIKIIPKTEGKWTPATYEGKQVTSIYSIRVEFQPTSADCKTAVDEYEAALMEVEKAITLHDEEKSEEGITTINEAIKVAPTNTEWLYFRGVMNLNLKNNDLACEDFQKIRDILTYPWYEKWIDIICAF
jgi:TonB family protein